MVFYTGGEQLVSQFDKGFKKQVEWDIPLLGGYEHLFLKNISKIPGSHHFRGIKNTDAIQEILKFSPDNILVYGWSYQSHLAILRHFKNKIPIYFRGDSTLLDNQNRLKDILRVLFLKWVYQYVDYAFYAGSANKRYYEKFGLKANQLIFAPHAIDNKRFSANRNEESEQLRKELDIDTSQILVLFAGKLEPKKNPQLLIKAFDLLSKVGIHLLFVGNGILEQDLKEQAKKKVRSSQIHFMDFQNQSQMPVVYQACDLFCLPSQGPGETWGLAINEAMAAGKAVLVSDKVGCAADLVKPEINGAVFKSADLADLKQKLKLLTANKDKLAEMGRASQRIIKDWCFEKQVTVIVDTIKNKDAK